MTSKKLKEMNERNKRYVQEAERRLEALGTELASVQSKRADMRRDPSEDLENKISDLRQSVRNLGKQAEALTDSGQQQWADLQVKIESGLWNIRAALQRFADGARPLIGPEEANSRSRYFLQKSAERGRWGLQRQNTSSAVKYFDRKQDALEFSRRYVRQKAPSELVVRRRDGTFEAVHSYR